MMTVALARGDATSAREAYYQMPESGKSAASTKYLMYKIALQEGDENLGTFKFNASFGPTDGYSFPVS